MSIKLIGKNREDVFYVLNFMTLQIFGYFAHKLFCNNVCLGKDTYAIFDFGKFNYDKVVMKNLLNS